MICKECGAKLPPDQTVCPRCGSLQPQAVRSVKKRQKTTMRAAGTTLASEQKSQKQMVYTRSDKFILGGAVALAFCAVIWFVSVLVGTMDSSKAGSATESKTQQMTSSSVVTTIESE